MATLAIDLGGTSMKAGVFQGGQLTCQREFNHDGKLGADFLVRDLLSVVAEMSTAASVSSIGLSVTGQIDSRAGVVVFATDSLPGFTGTPIRKIVSDAARVPVSIENDVNCAALGEAFYGAGQNYNDFLCLTYGTGVGGAVIMNRKIWTGLNGVAGEFGHMVLHAGGETCVCGRKGCYERYAATNALIRRVHAKTGLLMNGREIFQRFSQPEIRKELDLWINEVAEGLISLFHIFNPSAVLLGGGIMAQDYVFEEVKKRVQTGALPAFRQTAVVRAHLGNSAGMYGAYSLTLKDKGD